MKNHPITDHQLENINKITVCYEDLFNKRAQLYKQRNLNTQNLQDRDFKALLLEHYTFLKRPVLVYDQTLFVGNSPKTIEAANTFLREQ
ncbi:MAG: ArsC/Spx/MgsR family protein [Flavobacteriaceae bacterium]